MSTKQFPAAYVASVYTGYILCREKMQGIYDVLNFMSGESLFTHQLPRVAREARPLLAEQIDWLEDTKRIVSERLDKLESGSQERGDEAFALGDYINDRYGMVTVRSMAPDDHEIVDFVEDAKRINPNIKPITFDVDSGEVTSND